MVQEGRLLPPLLQAPLPPQPLREVRANFRALDMCCGSYET